MQQQIVETGQLFTDGLRSAVSPGPLFTYTRDGHFRSANLRGSDLSLVQ